MLCLILKNVVSPFLAHISNTGVLCITVTEVNMLSTATDMKLPHFSMFRSPIVIRSNKSGSPYQSGFHSTTHVLVHRVAAHSPNYRISRL